MQEHAESLCSGHVEDDEGRVRLATSPLLWRLYSTKRFVRFHRPGVVSLLSAVLAVASSEAVSARSIQSVPEFSLPAPNGEPDHEFRRVRAVRELSDGRVIVLDCCDRDHPLLVVDFTRGRATPIGRRGSGPGEYQFLRSLVPLGRDTSLLTDEGLRRWLILYRDSVVLTLRADRALLRSMGQLLLGGDRRARVLSLRGSGFLDPVPVHGAFYADSALLLRGDLHRHRIDTVGRLRGGRARMEQVQFAGGNGASPTYFTPNPLAATDQALLHVDGWIAVAHIDPFAVDWISPTGERIIGKTLPVATVRVTEAERRAAMDRQFGAQSKSTATSAFTDWPQRVPPFLEDALLPLASGEVAIHRTNLGRVPRERYDIFDRRSGLIATIRTGRNERIVGFGVRGIFVEHTSADGFVHLKRHPLPAGLGVRHGTR